MSTDFEIISISFQLQAAIAIKVRYLLNKYGEMRMSLSFIAFMILFSACDYFGDPGSEVILNLDTEFEIVMKEELSKESRQLSFEITSVDQLQCEDTKIDLNNTILNSGISIVVNNITMPAQCGNNESYPTGTATFDVSSRNYLFEFQVQEQQAQFGEFIVSPGSYYLDINKARGLIIDYPELNRIPDNFVWGYYQARNIEEKDLLEEFLSNNNLVVKPSTYLHPGHYSYFSIDKDGNVNPYELPTEGIIKALAFDLLQLDDIKEVVSDFKSANPDLVLILNGSDGSLL